MHRASVNNFGFGGSNAHVIIENAQGYLSSRGLIGKYKSPMKPLKKAQEPMNVDISPRGRGKSRVFVLSSFNESSGKQQAESLHQYLDKQRENHPSRFLDDLAFTLGKHRSVLPWKAVFTASSRSQLAEALTSDNFRFANAPKARTLGFVFTGQGAQWYAMGRELIDHYPVFRGSLDSAERHLKAFGAPWSLFGKLGPSPRGLIKVISR